MKPSAFAAEATSQELTKAIHDFFQCMVKSDLESPPESNTLQMSHFMEHGSWCPDEDGYVVLEAVPIGEAGNARLFVMVQCDEPAEIERIFAYAPGELFDSLREAIASVVDASPALSENAQRYIERFNLNGMPTKRV